MTSSIFIDYLLKQKSPNNLLSIQKKYAEALLTSASCIQGSIFVFFFFRVISWASKPDGLYLPGSNLGHLDKSAKLKKE